MHISVLKEVKEMAMQWKTFEAELTLTDTVSKEAVVAALRAVPENTKRSFVDSVARRLGETPLPHFCFFSVPGLGLHSCHGIFVYEVEYLCV